MKVNQEKLKNLFTYHPPDKQRAKKHQEWNQLVIDFVIKSSELIEDPGDFTVLLRKLSEIRMLGNQTITNIALNNSIRDIFEP